MNVRKSDSHSSTIYINMSRLSCKLHDSRNIGELVTGRCCIYLVEVKHAGDNKRIRYRIGVTSLQVKAVPLSHACKYILPIASEILLDY
jgi:hypothetical protein